MKLKRTSFRGLAILASVVTLIVALVGVFIFMQNANAQSTIAQSAIVGSYTVQTTFLSGPQVGQTEQGTLTFNGDGTVTSSYPNKSLTGAGYWWIVNNQVQYSVRQIFPDGSGDVQVVHLVTTYTSDGFSSDGRGIISNPQGTPVGIAQTVNKATRNS